jgi:hypothetical protein
MTTQNPRLTITLQPTLAAQLRKLSELTGNSQSGLIAELLQGSSVVFDRLILVLTAAKDARSAMVGQAVTDLGSAQEKIEKQLGLGLDEFFDGTQPFLDEFETVKRRGRKTGRGGASLAGGSSAVLAKPTPISNRGVRSTPIATKKIAQSTRPGKVKS